MSSFIPADEYVTDTMALVLHLENRKSSQNVKQIFDSADSGKTTIYIPAMVFAEILYLAEKQRISLNLHEVEKHIKNFQTYREVPLSFEIIQNAQQITDIPELHDRLIASTASFLNLVLITNDPKIENSQFVNTVW
jgi:predicted nucleic acid-binding protein